MKTPLSLMMLAALPLPALAEVPQVVTDIPATGSLVQQVLGDLGQAHVLLPAGASAHHYQMRPSDAEALDQADLLVWIGAGLTPWLERGAANLPDGHSMMLSELPQTYRQNFGETGAHDHDEHEGHDDHADHEDHEDHDDHDEHEAHDGHDDHDGHDHSGLDPHMWLDPANGAVWLDAIAQALSARDPDNAAQYAANAEEARKAIAAEDARLTARLEPLRDKAFVVFHDAYGYFTGHYGLTPPVAVALGDASPPSAGRLSEIRGDLAAKGVTCAFPEAQHSPALVKTVIEGTGVRLGAALDPSGSGTEMGPDLYVRLLGSLGDGIADCLEDK